MWCCLQFLISTECDNGDVRLVGGPNEIFGRVEICVARNWGKVCGDSHWDDLDAATVCWQLGFPTHCKLFLQKFCTARHAHL